jgi:hypothetical protein
MFYTIFCIKIEGSLRTMADVGSIIEKDGITLLVLMIVMEPIVWHWEPRPIIAVMILL